MIFSPISVTYLVISSAVEDNDKEPVQTFVWIFESVLKKPPSALKKRLRSANMTHVELVKGQDLSLDILQKPVEPAEEQVR